jgi:heterodisulfide reductase subunit A-like polyferredoxin
LRGVAEIGMANAVARSPFVNTVDENLCTGCGLCVEQCQFEALSLGNVAEVDVARCVGCGVCVEVCADEALAMVRRPEDEVLPVPADYKTWGIERGAVRGIDLSEIQWRRFTFS